MNRTLLGSLVVLHCLGFLIGCVTEPVAKNQSEEVHAKASLMAKSQSSVSGQMTLEQTQGGVLLSYDVLGLKKNSLHGFHIHEKGDCSAPDASSAGGHFNPEAKEHGSVTGSNRHHGDLGNLTSDSMGVAKGQVLVPGGNLKGEKSLVGRSIVVHANTDDLRSQPAGNAGARIACGVIVAGK